MECSVNLCLLKRRIKPCSHVLKHSGSIGMELGQCLTKFSWICSLNPFGTPLLNSLKPYKTPFQNGSMFTWLMRQVMFTLVRQVLEQLLLDLTILPHWLAKHFLKTKANACNGSGRWLLPQQQQVNCLKMSRISSPKEAYLKRIIQRGGIPVFSRNLMPGAFQKPKKKRWSKMRLKLEKN